MSWIGRPNCEHLDNHGNCRIHLPGLIAAFFGVQRPRCIIYRNDLPADGVWTCPDQKELPRPSAPAPKSRK